MKTVFTVITNELRKAVSDIERIGSRFSKKTLIKISVLPDSIELSKQGILRAVKANTENFADVILPAVLIKGYLSAVSGATLTFEISKGRLDCGTSFFTSDAINVETIFSFPDNILPINASRLSILRYAKTASVQDIEKLKLSGTIKYAKRISSEKLQQAAEFLKDYDITYEDLNDLLNQKINR